MRNSPVTTLQCVEIQSNPTQSLTAGVSFPSNPPAPLAIEKRDRRKRGGLVGDRQSWLQVPSARTVQAKRTLRNHLPLNVLSPGLLQLLCYWVLCNLNPVSRSNKKVEKYHIDLIQYTYQWFENIKEITSAKLCRCWTDKHWWGLSVHKSRARTFSKLLLYKRCLSTIKLQTMHQGEKNPPLSRESGAVDAKPKTRKGLEVIIIMNNKAGAPIVIRGSKEIREKKQGVIQYPSTHNDKDKHKNHTFFKKLLQILGIFN